MSEGGMEGPDKKGLTRRGVLLGGAAVVAASGLEACSPDTPEKKEVVPEKPVVQELPKEPLSQRQEKDVQEVLDRAVTKWDKIGKTLLFETMNGALAKNYRQFVVLHAAGYRHAEKGLDNDEDIIAKREKLLSEPEFKTAFLRALVQHGYFKKLSQKQEEHLYQTDEPYANFRESLWASMPGSEQARSSPKPEELNWHDPVTVVQFANKMQITVRYFNSRDNGISFSHTIYFKSDLEHR